MSEPYLDPYAVLGLTRSAAAGEIKRAYFALVKANPPERNPEQFKRIRAAYERLRDPAQRCEVDMLLIQPWPEPVRRKCPPPLALGVSPADVLAILRALTDLDRTDWREHYEKVQL
ncbi:MAG: J domain-containing protein [Chloroflexales bacterium]